MTTSTPRVRVLAALVGLVAPASLALATDSAAAAHPAASERVPTARYITATVNKKAVVKGRKVKISGAVDAPGAPACAIGVTLDVERSTKGAIYKTVGHVTTDAYGAYKVKAVVNKKSRFRVSVGATEACSDAQSPPRTVSLKKKR